MAAAAQEGAARSATGSARCTPLQRLRVPYGPLQPLRAPYSPVQPLTAPRSGHATISHTPHIPNARLPSPMHPLTPPYTPLHPLTPLNQVPQHETNWVACDACGKWRKLPPGVRLEEEQAPGSKESGQVEITCDLLTCLLAYLLTCLLAYSLTCLLAHQASSRWLCKHNVWDRKRQSCKAAEEPWA